jgi:UDP-N-acetylmuramyl-tripeptide synthetase
MKLSELVRTIPGARLIGADLDVRAVTSDSRAVSAGALFIAVRGRRSDGHAFVAAAIERGAAAVAVEAPIDGLAVPQLVVADGARALGFAIAALADHPARRLTLIGITGTNGKTTTTYLVEAILRAAGHNPGVIGTVNYRWNGQRHDAPYTTPTPDVLHATLAQMVADGVTHAVMEVSSAALAMNRLAGLEFAVAAFSNLTQDHLDVHGSMDEYAEAKQLLFRRHLAPHGVAVVNVDDPAGASMGAAASATIEPRLVLTVSSDATASEAQAAAPRSASSPRTRRWPACAPTSARRAASSTVATRVLIGHFNVANLALAIGIAEALGVPHDAIARGIATVAGVPGRVERVDNDAGLDVLVDYAHTPDALDNVLRALRPLTRRGSSACSAAAAIAIPASARWARWSRPAPTSRWSPATTRAPRIPARSSIRSCRRCRRRSWSTSIAAPRSAPRWPRPRRATSWSSPARATRTTRSSARPSITSTIARRPSRRSRCARASTPRPSPPAPAAASTATRCAAG